MSTPTCKQFKDSRRHVDDLEAALNMSIYDDPNIKCPGLIYLDSFYIEERNDNWTDASKAAGRYFLVIGNWDCVTDDLEALERKLFDYAIHEFC